MAAYGWRLWVAVSACALALVFGVGSASASATATATYPCTSCAISGPWQTTITLNDPAGIYHVQFTFPGAAGAGFFTFKTYSTNDGKSVWSCTNNNGDDGAFDGVQCFDPNGPPGPGNINGDTPPTQLVVTLGMPCGYGFDPATSSATGPATADVQTAQFITTQIDTATIASPSPTTHFISCTKTELFDNTTNQDVTDQTQNVLTGTHISLTAKLASTNVQNPQWTIAGSSSPDTSTAVKDYQLDSANAASGVSPTALQSADLQSTSLQFYVVNTGTFQVRFSAKVDNKDVQMETTLTAEAPTVTGSRQWCPHLGAAYEASPPGGTPGYQFGLVQTVSNNRLAGVFPNLAPQSIGCTMAAPGGGGSGFTPYTWQTTFTVQLPTDITSPYPSDGQINLSQLIRRLATFGPNGCCGLKVTTAGQFWLDNAAFYGHEDAPGLSAETNDRNPLSIDPSQSQTIVTADGVRLPLGRLGGTLGEALNYGLSTFANDDVSLQTHVVFEPTNGIWVSLGEFDLSYSGTLFGHCCVTKSSGPFASALVQSTSLITAPSILGNG
jgi:hypothetical protein